MGLLIAGGRVVTTRETTPADVLVMDGRIVETGASLPHEAHEVYDATGCLVFPGFIDAHTHLEMFNGVTTTSDNFETGSHAALSGGTTTLIDFATQERGGTLVQALENWHARADGMCGCDYGFHMAITDWNDRTRAELVQMAAAGVTSFKLYMAYDNLRLDDAAIFQVLRAAHELNGLVGMHCENGDLVNELCAQYLVRGYTEPRYHPLSRPAFVEAEAVERFCRIGQAAGTPVHIVHLSSAEGMEAVRRARARGQHVFVETCPQYLLLDESRYELPGFEGAKYVCSPPLRATADLSALWQAIEQGEIQTISTDHCNFLFDGQKTLGRGNFTAIPNGMPGMEHRPVLIYSAGVHSGRITENQMAALLSEHAARLFGLYPRKGALLPGSDADLVIWDPSVQQTITAQTQKQRCDYTPFEGMTVHGAARAVFLRGELVAEQGKVVHARRGQYIFRGACAALPTRPYKRPTFSEATERIQ